MIGERTEGAKLAGSAREEEGLFLKSLELLKREELRRDDAESEGRTS